MNIPDAPDIRRTEATGYPDDNIRWPVCPICGEECDTLYRAAEGEVVGCDQCITAIDAWEVMNND